MEAVLLSAVQALEHQSGNAVILGVHIVLRRTCHGHQTKILGIGRRIIQSAVIVTIGIEGNQIVQGNIRSLVGCGNNR